MSELSEYFSVNNCIKGLSILSKSLFGINIEVVKMVEGESWHSSVIKLQFSNENTNEILGYVYLDLISRNGKFNHPSTFAIKFPKISGKTKDLEDIPRVAVCCSFHTSANNPFLLHSDVETLFHEFGHCLSSILSRTEYQHVAGTRAALDYVETPSTLMEYFVWDYRILSLFATHHKTGKVLPLELLDSMKKTKQLFSGLDTQQNILNALFDMELHSHSQVKNSIELYGELQNKYTSIPFVPGTHWHSRFGHLIGYAAGYYSYIFCRVFSSNIWHKYFKSNPLDREMGIKYRNEILKLGGSKNPQMILENYLQFDPLNDSNFLKEFENK
jgi:intermediate peptidase